MAMTDVRVCEKVPEQAYRLNALGTHNLPLACQRGTAAMLYVSTDYVFDGMREEPYLEYDEPNPYSVYARSKLAREGLVRDLSQGSISCSRLGWKATTARTSCRGLCS